MVADIDSASDLNPTAFTKWDHDGDGTQSLFVMHLFEGESTRISGDKDMARDILMFDIGAGGRISNPQYVWGRGASGWSGWSSDSGSLEVVSHNGRSIVKGVANAFDSDDGVDEFTSYLFSQNDQFYHARSKNALNKELFLANIAGQYTEQLLSDSAFIKEASSSKGAGKHKVTAENRKPVDFVRWDHNDDGEKSLAVLNRAGNVFELILFDINEDNEVSNPRRIDERGSATWVWRSADLEVVDTYQGKFVRSKIWIGNSAPHVNYYSFQDRDFENRGRKTAEAGSECEVGFVYPKEDTVLNQGKRYEVRWKDLFNDVSRTRINPAVSRRNIKIINESEEVVGKLKTGYGLGEAAEWQSLRVLDLDGDSLADEGRLVEPGKYKLRADYYYSQKARDRLQDNGCDLSDKKANDTHYENVFESKWFTIKK